MNNQVETLKTTLAKTATELANKSNENKTAKEDLDEKRWVLSAG